MHGKGRVGSLAKYMCIWKCDACRNMSGTVAYHYIRGNKGIRLPYFCEKGETFVRGRAESFFFCDNNTFIPFHWLCS